MTNQKLSNIDNYEYVDQYNDLMPLNEKPLRTNRSIRKLINMAYGSKNKDRINRLRSKSKYRRSKNV